MVTQSLLRILRTWSPSRLHSQNTCKVLGMTMMKKGSSVGTGVTHGLQIRLHALRHRLHLQHGRRCVGRRCVGRRRVGRRRVGPVAIRELSLKKGQEETTHPIDTIKLFIALSASETFPPT